MNSHEKFNVQVVANRVVVVAMDLVVTHQNKMSFDANHHITCFSR